MLKKRWFSISMIIISTIISSCTMIYKSGYFCDEDRNQVIIQSDNNKVIQEKEVDKSDDKSAIETVQSNSIVSSDKSNKINTTDNNQQISKPEEKTVVNNENNDNVNSSQNEIVDSAVIKEESKGTNNTEETTSVFKVKKDDILGSLSFFDKEKLLFIAAKLSRSDYNKIMNFLRNDENGQGVINSLKLSKEKLSKKDYSKVKAIAGKFINLDAVEEN